MVPPLHEVRFIKKYAGNSGWMLDVGANLGCLAITMAHLRPDLAVHAFEPSPETFAALSSNVRESSTSHIYLHPLALGKERGRVTFLDDGKAPAMNRIIHGATDLPGRIINVEVQPLDAFLAQQGGGEVAFLKIDVEGFEPQVIQGAESLLTERRCKAGMVELCPANLKNAGTSVAELLSAVERVGYQLRFIQESGEPGAVVTVRTGEETVLTNVALMPIS